MGFKCGCIAITFTFGEVGKEWEEAFKNRVREAVKEQGVEMCGEGLDISILTPSRMARLAGEASAHSLASAIEVFTKVHSRQEAETATLEGCNLNKVQ